MSRGMRLVLAGLLILSLAPGCGGQSRTVKTERTVRYPVEEGKRLPEPVAVESATTTTTKDIGHRPTGVLSTTVHLIGEILALPFRLIGGLIRLIF